MPQSFGLTYPRIIQGGLAAAVWFAVFAQAAHDLWAACALFLGVTLLALLFLYGRWRRKQLIRLPLLGPVLLVLAAGLLSLWNSYDLGSTLFEFWGWFFTILIFYLFVNTLDEKLGAENFFILAGSVLAPLALLCSVPDTRQWLVGHRALLVNADVLAGFTLFWLFFFWMKTSEKRRFGIVFLSGVCLLLLAKSWWSFICLFLGALVYYRAGLVKVSARYKQAAGIAALAALVALILIIQYRLGRRLLGSPYPGTNRLFYWSAACRMWMHNLWTGVGLGGYAMAYPFFRVGPAEGTLFAHSWFLQWIAETGIVGLAALVWLVISYWELREKPGNLVMEATLFTVLLYSFININMDFLLNKIVFIIFLAATIDRRRSLSCRPKPLGLAAAAVALLLISALWLSLLQGSRFAASGLQCERSGNLSQAEQCYRNAIALNAFEADGYWGLARLYKSSYEKTRASDAMLAAQRFFQFAVRYRKDVKIMADFRNLARELPSVSPG